MTARERVSRALTFGGPDRVPRQLWHLPGVTMFRKQELDQMLELFPADIVAPAFSYGAARRSAGEPSRKGTYTDDWGCLWTVYEDGVVGEVKHPPLADWNALDSYQPPWEILDTDWGIASATKGSTDRFVLAGTTVRPFERMQFLRGTENLFMDMAAGDRRYFRLRDMVHEFFLADLEHWAQTDVDGISFMDDWGTQGALLIAPAMWRAYYKPLYREYVRLLHSKGKFAFFHSDGSIQSIIGDLVEIGIDALNAQLFCMDIDALGSRFKGKITFWGEIDRQRLLPFGTPAEVREAVRRVRRALDCGKGGVIAQCEWGLRDPFENIRAVFEAWME